MYKTYKSQTSDARQSAPNKDNKKTNKNKDTNKETNRNENRNADRNTNTNRNTNKNVRNNNQKSPKRQGTFNKPQNKVDKTRIKSTQTFAKGKLRVMALGGLEEVGRNMALIEYEKEIIIIDMGLMFPDEDMPGIDYIIPNTEYLEDKKDWIKGVVITHGHYDHIGAIPHIMPKIGNPAMFMGKMTAGLVRRRQKEYKNSSNLKIQEIDEHNKITLGRNFKVEFLRVNHSIPDCFAIIVHTPVGTVVHTGDFKIDFSPVNDKPADLNRIAQIGDKGVALLMSDSTDAISPGYQVSESVIGEEMGKLFEEIEGRIIIGTFASQLARVQKLFDLAAKHNKRIYLQGRSMVSNVEVAHEIGYLKFNPKLLLTDEEFKRIPDNQLVILGTGAQGETNAFLSKVVNGDHRVVSLKAGDTVIFSSSAIPGNERSIQHLMDAIVRQGAKTINYKMLDIHAGGHAKQEDLKLMIRLMKPEFFMPIEAHHFMLQAHAELASKVGVDRNNIFVADNGQVLEMRKEGERTEAVLTKEKIPTDYVMVDGLGVGDVSNIVLRDRRMMAADGMIVVIATIDSKTGDIIGNPDLISRGFIYMKANRDLIESTRMKVKKMVKDKPSTTPTDDDFLKNKIRNDIGQFLFNKTKRRPMVLPVVIKV
jgi:ribonuclease J